MIDWFLSKLSLTILALYFVTLNIYCSFDDQNIHETLFRIVKRNFVTLFKIYWISSIIAGFQATF